MASTSRAVYRDTAEENRGRRVFVRRIPPFTQSKSLMNLFKAYSPDQAVVVRKPAGTFAFVTFPTAELALGAVQWVETTKPVLHKRSIRAAVADAWNEAALLRPHARPDPFPGWEPRRSPPLPEVIARIAAYLNFADRGRMEVVCRAWRVGALASYASERILTTADWRWPQGWSQPCINTETFNWAIRRMGPYINTLRLDDQWVAGRLRPQVLAIAARNYPQLTAIDLTGATIRPSGIRDLVHTAGTLLSLHLGKTDGNVEPELSALFAAAPSLADFRATNSGFVGAALPRMTPALRELRFRDCASLLAAPVAACLATQRSLSSLELAQCRALTSAAPLAALMPEEEDVEMPDAPPVPNPVFVELQLGPVETARSLPEVFMQLATLRVLFCGLVDITFVRHIGEHLKHLIELDLSRCSNIRGQFALEALGNLPWLEKVTINNLHPSVTAPALATIESLREVRARDSQGITDEDTTPSSADARSSRYLTSKDAWE